MDIIFCTRLALSPDLRCFYFCYPFPFNLISGERLLDWVIGMSPYIDNTELMYY